MYSSNKNYKTMEAIKNPNKRVNVISLEVKNDAGEVVNQPGNLMRTTRSFAAKLVAQGTHAYTSKSKLKSFLNKEAKLHRNKRAVEVFGTTNGGQWKDKTSGKKYTDLTTARFVHKHTNFDKPKNMKFVETLNFYGRKLSKKGAVIKRGTQVSKKLRKDAELMEETGSQRIVTQFNI